MGLFTRIPVTSEIAAVGNLSSLFQPDYANKTIFHDKVIFVTELGYKISFVRQGTKIRSYSLEWPALTLSQMQAIQTFYAAHNADLTPFLFTPPDETSNLKFIFAGELDSTKLDNNVYSCRVDILQILLGA